MNKNNNPKYNSLNFCTFLILEFIISLGTVYSIIILIELIYKILIINYENKLRREVYEITPDSDL